MACVSDFDAVRELRSRGYLAGWLDDGTLRVVGGKADGPPFAASMIDIIPELVPGPDELLPRILATVGQPPAWHRLESLSAQQPDWRNALGVASH